MNNTKKTLVAGSLIAGAVFGAASLHANANDLFRFDELGSGATVRAHLLDQSETNLKAFLLELSCGEDAKKDPADAKKFPATKKADDKSIEAKCGEGKCGEGTSKDMKTGATADTTKAAKDSKSAEGKCGEGKCGVE